MAQDGYEINFSVLDLKDMQVVASCKGHQDTPLCSQGQGVYPEFIDGSHFKDWFTCEIVVSSASNQAKRILFPSLRGVCCVFALS